MAGPDFTQLVTINVVSGDALQTKRSGELKSLIDQDGVFYTAAYVVGTQGLVAGNGYFVPGTGLSILANGDVFTHGGVLVNVPTGHPQKPLDVMVNGALKVRIDTDGILSVLNSFYTGPGRITVIPQDTVNEGGEILFSGAGSNRYFYIDNFQGNMRVITQDASGESEKFRISNAGNVGIGTGTASPAERLEVAGNVKVTAGSLSLDETQRLYFNALGGNRYVYTNSNNQFPDGVSGRITFSYNAFVKFNGGQGGEPTALWIGLDRNNLMYLFFQDRADGFGGKWAGVQTFKRADFPNDETDWGYGYQPMRVWGKNMQAGPDGTLTLKNGPVAPAIYFQEQLVHLQHRKMEDGSFQVPDTYTNDRPFKAGFELGGIRYDPAQLGVKVYRSGNDLLFADVGNQSGVRLGTLVRGNVDKLIVAIGETQVVPSIPAATDRDFGLFPLPSGLFTSQPKIYLTPRNSGGAWAVTLAVYNATETQFGIMGRNNHPTVAANISIQWVAVGT